MALDDAQIVAVIQAADTGEIAQAREVLKKSKNARVRQFAQHMITAHSAAESKIANIDGKIGLTPQTNAVAEQLTSGSEQVMGNLRSASGSDFDKTYVDAQVTQHTKVLDLLDNKLIPHAQNSDLVKALQEIRAKVAGHLNDAQALQTSLGQSQ
jgi:putative membrane protein